MAKVGSLIIDLAANVASLQKDMQAARKTLDSGLGQMKGVLQKFSTVAGGYLGGQALLQFAHQTLEAASTISRTAEQVGIGVEALQELRHAASTTGIAAEDMDQIIRDLGDRMGDAAGGSKSWQEAFAALNVEIKDAAGNMRPVEDVLLDVADGMKNADSDATRLFRSMELFSDQGAKLLPILKQGRAGFERLGVEAHDLGLVIDAETAAAAEHLTQNFTIMRQRAQGAANEFMAGMLPALNEVTDGFTEASDAASEFSTRVAGAAAIATLRQPLAAVSEAFYQVDTAATATGDALFGLTTGNLDGVRNLGRAGDEMAESFGSWFQLATTGTRTTTELGEALGGVNRFARNASQQVQDLSDSMREMAQASFSAAAEFGERVRSQMEQARKEAARLAEETARLAAEAQERTAASFLRLEGLQAQLTADTIDDIQATYSARYAALQKQIEDERATEAERAALRQEMAALELLEVQEIEAEKARIAEEAHAQSERKQTRTSRTEVDKRAQDLRRSAESAASYFSGAFTNLLIAPLQDGFNGMKDILAGLKNILIDLLARLASSALLQLLLTATGLAPAGGFGGGFLELLGFSRGGRVPGSGSPTRDTVPAMLAPGEYVLRASAVRQVGTAMLDQINQGMVPAKFSDGGLVGAAPAAAAQQVVVHNSFRALSPHDALAVFKGSISDGIKMASTTRQNARTFDALTPVAPRFA